MALAENLAPAASDTNEHSYVDWPAIFAGTVLATAISFVLLTFGSAIGLSLTSAYEGRGMTLFWFAIAAALWVLWVQISSFTAGGYLTGRLRRRNYDATEHESDIRDGSHGLVMWALAVLIGAFVALTGVSAAVSTATSAASTVAAGAAAGAAGNADDMMSDGNSLLVDRLLRSTSATAQPTTADTRGEVTRIIGGALADDELQDADRQYLASVVSARSGISQEEAQARVDETWTQAQEAKAAAQEAAETARRIGLVAAFLTAASLFASALGAYFGATLGGNHRDKQVVVEGWYKPW